VAAQLVQKVGGMGKETSCILPLYQPFLENYTIPPLYQLMKNESAYSENKAVTPVQKLYLSEVRTVANLRQPFLIKPLPKPMSTFHLPARIGIILTVLFCIDACKEKEEA
jgi:hypothetical protein